MPEESPGLIPFLAVQGAAEAASFWAITGPLKPVGQERRGAGFRKHF